MVFRVNFHNYWAYHLWNIRCNHPPSGDQSSIDNRLHLDSTISVRHNVPSHPTPNLHSDQLCGTNGRMDWDNISCSILSDHDSHSCWRDSDSCQRADYRLYGGKGTHGHCSQLGFRSGVRLRNVERPKLEVFRRRPQHTTTYDRRYDAKCKRSGRRSFRF